MFGFGSKNTPEPAPAPDYSGELDSGPSHAPSINSSNFMESSSSSASEDAELQV